LIKKVLPDVMVCVSEMLELNDERAILGGAHRRPASNAPK
jgi:hypothetical protein